MRQRNRTLQEERVLVLAPTAADAALTEALLAEAGLDRHLCTDLMHLCREARGGAGAILLTEEVLADGEAGCLAETLAEQPPWSDMPIVLLTTSGADSPIAAWAMDLLGSVTVLERPVRLTTLVSSLRSALRARRRQYELRSRMEALSSQSERLRLLWEAASVLLASDQPDTMMRDLFAKIAPHLGLDAYFNFMMDPSGDALRMESCQGIPDEEARKITRLHFGQAICGTVALHREPIVATFIQQSDDPKAQLVKSYGIRVYACNPLMAGDRLLGTLSFASRQRDSFEEEELAFLRTICHYVAYAYERMRLIRQLREEDRKKDDFLATLAHELRSPLAPIRNGVEYMRLRGSNDPDLQNAQNIIERQVRQMTRLVDDLLDISRITRGKVVLQRERVSLGLALTSAIESSRPVIDQGGHELTIALPTEPLFVDGDVTRLAQVFGNLLTNAAKYMDRGGSIHVSAERLGSDVAVSVRDTGIGIAREHLPRLFDMFSQVEPALARSQGGLGIGLALVRNLVALHGGRVEAHSDGPARGSKFTVYLPLVIDSPKATAAEEEQRRLQADALRPKRRILVADDNPDSAQTMGILLSLMGHEVRTAHDGLAAVELAEEFQPEVVLLDIGMPKLNGYETARRLRQRPWAANALLVALTGWGQEEDKRRAVEAGFDHHFTKPVDHAELESLFARWPTTTAQENQPM